MKREVQTILSLVFVVMGPWYPITGDTLKTEILNPSQMSALSPFPAGAISSAVTDEVRCEMLAGM